MPAGFLFRSMPLWFAGACGLFLLVTILAPVKVIRKLIGLIQSTQLPPHQAKRAKGVVVGLFLRQALAALCLLGLLIDVALRHQVLVVLGLAIGLLFVSTMWKIRAGLAMAHAMISAEIAKDIQPTAQVSLAYSDHYRKTLQAVGGQPCQLTLVEVTVEGPAVVLVYQWSDDLSHPEADKVDSRARAYISCAIYEAARQAGLSCQVGPPHGQRPSWQISGRSAPISLMAAGFDVSEKVCWMHVGPVVSGIGIPPGSESVAENLAKGFQSCFGKITV